MDEPELHRVVIPRVVVPERGRVALGRAEWTALRHSPTFWRLVDDGVVSVTTRPDEGAVLNGAHLVGRALCDATVLECTEKIPGALLSLAAAALDALSVKDIPAPATELGPLMVLLVRRFVDAVRTYVSDGRNWTYVTQRRVSALIGGRLHVPSTVRLRAQGLRHVVAFDRFAIDHATETNQVIFAGLREVETLSRLLPIDAAILADARAMSLFFDDCRLPQMLFGTRASLASRAQRLADRGDEGAPRHLLQLAALLLGHHSFDAGAPLTEAATPVSWFVNLETLFEQAVRRTLTQHVSLPARVFKGGSTGRAVFPDKSILKVDPDLVIQTITGCVVGDVKYKDWNASATPPDIYQLLVHARTFAAHAAFLVYPSDAFKQVPLGTATTGARTWLFAVDVRDLDSSVIALRDALPLCNG
jgi:5-methylcytosine-specific restriction endonuclease McrBC regulatory subunit McrC